VPPTLNLIFPDLCCMMEGLIVYLYVRRGKVYHIYLQNLRGGGAERGGEASDQFTTLNRKLRMQQKTFVGNSPLD